MRRSDVGYHQALAQEHSRRSEADKSVSLVHPNFEHESTRSSGHINDMARKSTTQSVTSVDVNSPDESGNDAKRWFDRSNLHMDKVVKPTQDDSPPFFIQQFSRDNKGPNDVPSPNHNCTYPHIIHKHGDDSSDEFRGIIDDLTVENQKLSKRLGRYESTHDAHLNSEKLFEVRMHKLSTNKKKELEDILRRFVSGLDGPNSSMPIGNRQLRPPKLTHETSASSESSNVFHDSAYASGSVSNPSSMNHMLQCKKSSSKIASQRHNVENYLHDMSENHHIYQDAAITDKAKKSLIVRRLEQIFTGKGASIGSGQSQQQQELSNHAATVDRRALEKLGIYIQPEGRRETLIMNQPVPVLEADRQDAKPLGENAGVKQDLDHEIDQRPTRPLDLDVNRAQLASDNIDYIRHLGFSSFSPPQQVENEAADTENHGWVYLNLLSNMAQLHTLNVTPDFICKAVRDGSHTFEVSEDGRKVRWKRGTSLVQIIYDESKEVKGYSMNRDKESSSVGNTPRKRIKYTMPQKSTNLARFQRNDSTTTDQSRSTCTPLFHTESSIEDSRSGSGISSKEQQDDWFKEISRPLQEESLMSTMYNTCSETVQQRRIPDNGPRQRRVPDNGPMVFYNQAPFCTDLSQDFRAEEIMMYNAYLYHKAVDFPLGIVSRSIIQDDGAETTKERPFQSHLPQQKNMAVEEQILMVHDTESKPTDKKVGKAGLVYFEASGLGGTCPADNFVIDVESCYSKSSIPAYRSTLPSIAHRLISDDINEPPASSFIHRIVSIVRQDLEPSAVPDAGCVVIGSDDYSLYDDSDDNDDDMWATNLDNECIDPIAQKLAITTRSIHVKDSSSSLGAKREDDDYYDYYDDDVDDNDKDEDVSVDFLAEIRRHDPMAVQALERVYDANMADRLAEEIPAGSSAATAGGGSGYASPVSSIGGDEHKNRHGLVKYDEKEDKNTTKKDRKRKWDDVVAV